jgi:hypothetical protein
MGGGSVQEKILVKLTYAMTMNRTKAYALPPVVFSASPFRIVMWIVLAELLHMGAWAANAKLADASPLAPITFITVPAVSAVADDIRLAAAQICCPSAPVPTLTVTVELPPIAMLSEMTTPASIIRAPAGIDTSIAPIIPAPVLVSGVSSDLLRPVTPVPVMLESPVIVLPDKVSPLRVVPVNVKLLFRFSIRDSILASPTLLLIVKSSFSFR